MSTNVFANRTDMDRREFVKYAGLLATSIGVNLGIGSLLTACGDSPATAPNDDLPDLVARIQGPRTLRLGETGESNTAYYSDSRPRDIIEREDWNIRRITEPAQEDFTHFGEGQQATYLFKEDDADRTFEIRLDVKSKNDQQQAFHETEVLPYEPPPPPYSVPIAFFRFGSTGTSLCFMPPTDPALSRIELEDNSLSTNRVSWEPNGSRVVLSRFGVGRAVDLYLYHVNTNQLSKILPEENENGIIWQASWSPKGDWIVGVDDTRVPNNAADELFLTEPYSNTRHYLSGSSPSELYYGLYPSWFPDGQRIVLGSTFFQSGQGLRKRLAIYSNLWDSNPTREILHTETQLLQAFGSSVVLENVDEGVNGVAVSPDGDLVAYSVVFPLADVETPQLKIVIAKGDGSGIVEILERDNAGHPTWSPDGKHIYFSAHVGPGVEFNIFRYDLDTKEETNMSLLTNLPGTPDEVCPAWYG